MSSGELRVTSGESRREREAREVEARKRAVREAKERALAEGRKAPTMDELTEQLGDEVGISVETRRREGGRGAR